MQSRLAALRSFLVFCLTGSVLMYGQRMLPPLQQLQLCDNTLLNASYYIKSVTNLLVLLMLYCSLRCNA
jgi:hypothetical protein